MRIPFDIKFRPQIESGEYKVETDSKEPVTIIKWDLKNEDGNILCYYFDSKEEIPYVTSGKDLFLIIPEPELSEDERIRETLIHIVKGACCKYGIKYIGDDITEEKLLTYLERQKEYIDDIRQYAYNKGLVDAEEKQKPLSTEETELNSIAFLEQLGYTCVPPGAEHKPAEWSEEDKEYFDAIIAKLEVTQDDAMLTDGQMSFLKSLPKRFNLQPKLEWNEEDEKHRQWILECLADGKRKVPEFAEQYQAAFDWLKSLRPQPHWKPSESQIQALGIVLDYHVFASSKNKEHIKSLYSDLKNL